MDYKTFIIGEAVSWLLKQLVRHRYRLKLVSFLKICISWELNPSIVVQKIDDHDKVSGSRVSSLSRSRDGTSSPRLMRRPSLVGPSVALGITTMSASDVSDLYW